MVLICMGHVLMTMTLPNPVHVTPDFLLLLPHTTFHCIAVSVGIFIMAYQWRSHTNRLNCLDPAEHLPLINY